MTHIDEDQPKGLESLTSITAMEEYKDFSVEELRYEDYECIRIAKTYAPYLEKIKSPEPSCAEKTHCPICLETIQEVYSSISKN